MREEECGLLPYERDQLVEIVRRGRPATRLDSLLRCDIGEDPVFAVVKNLRLLALLDCLDRETELLFDLIVRMAVKV
jgi:hypothetical protein